MLEGVNRHPIGCVKPPGGPREVTNRLAARVRGRSASRSVRADRAPHRTHRRAETAYDRIGHRLEARDHRPPRPRTSKVHWSHAAAAGFVRVTGVYAPYDERTPRAGAAQQKAPARKGASWNFAISASS
jgi:hypothetical protein